ncbi:DnaB family ATPase [uncultured Duncaniella sp.]|uniref:DnaB family ATPase n=1 Tax=uncultured Duncaniella sp. TaxID=2768039 RepID=UPI00260D7F4C|nr:DnaB family ATPase [uncultured Duncaniella sp.]
MSVDYIKMLKRTGALPIHQDLDTLDLYCEYLLNYDNRTINYSNLSNLKDYFSRVGEETFKQNEAKMARYFFIKYFLEARLDKGIVSPKLCIQYVYDRVSKKYGAIIKRDIIESIEHNKMGKKDVEFMNSMVFSQLNTIFMHDYAAAITKLLGDLKNNEFGREAEDCDNAIRLFQSLLNELTKAQRKSKQENRFNLSDKDHFNAMMLEAAERALSNAHYLQTGWQGLNKMLGGGFEDARVYNFIGATGGFKSGLLLNLMKQIKLYNKGRPHKDPTKRPTILFLSQENNIWETFLRIYGIFGGTDIKNHSVKEILDILSKGGFTVVQDELDIDIEFRYYGNMDIGVNDIRGIVQELENSGRECICIIQDYIERLRPPVMLTEKRNALSDVSNQMHDLSIELDIPIITASQFNREGVSTIEDQRDKGKKDIAKQVGTGNISESFGMLKNFDVNVAIVIEYDAAEERFYLSFRKLKYRGDETGTIDYFLQPFAGKNSKIQLQDDIATDPVYRLSMLDELGAQLHEDIDHIEVLTRQNVSFLDPISDDPDDEASINFIGNMFSDIDRSGVEQEDMLRDEDGFIILIHKQPLLDLAGLPGVHVMS